MRGKAIAISCRPNSSAMALSSAAEVDPNRFAGASQAAARVKVRDGVSPFMGALGRRHASRADKVRFFQGKIDSGAINRDALPGLLRDYPELVVPMGLKSKVSGGEFQVGEKTTEGGL